MPATASDYANMIWGALRLLQATNEAELSLLRPSAGAPRSMRHYWVADGGGYAFTADDTPDVIVRMRGAHDDATPNANAVMISNLVALHLLTGKPAYLERAHAIPQAFAADLGSNPLGHCGLLAGFFDLIAPQHVVVIGPPTPDAVREARPRHVQALAARRRAADRWTSAPAAEPGALAGKTAIEGKPTAYACLGPQCSLPVTDADVLLALLREQRSLAGQ